jgi:hypothetical protein
MVKPSTAFSGAVAWSAGVVVLNEADTRLPAARSGAESVRSTPAFWNMSTMRASSHRLTCGASDSRPPPLYVTRALPPPWIPTLPVRADHVTWARSETVNTRRESR